MAKEMLINTVEGQECRIAIVDGRTLEELYVERTSSASHVGNIYKGRVTNVEPSIQAAFVDFGLPRNGFLHISDISPQYFPKGRRTAAESIGQKHAHRDRPPIQECLRRGQEVVVQMTKEGIGTKGPTLTTYLSIPGKLLVMMPGMSRLGVSRKVEDEKSRAAARAQLADLSLPQDMGFIVRTAGITANKRDIRRDLNYLLRLWKTVEKRIKTSRSACEIYQESDLVTRTIRDVYNTDTQRILCDSEAVAVKMKEFLDVAMPRTKHPIELYVGKEGLFHEYGLEKEIEKIYSRRVELPSGGSLVIDQTEALVAIDVNSGRFREHSDAETTAMKMNVEAAGEIARQLRLRDMGGVIVIDFIDMREDKNRRAVERALREAMKPDRAKTKVLRISSFCIVEMTRQRVRPSLRDSIYSRCTCCSGTGFVKSQESLALQVMRSLQRVTSQDDVAQVDVKVSPSVAHHLSNYQRAQISHLEQASTKRVLIHADGDLPGDAVEITCVNQRGSVVAWSPEPTSQQQAKPVEALGIEQLMKKRGAGTPEPAEEPLADLFEEEDEEPLPRPGPSRQPPAPAKQQPASARLHPGLAKQQPVPAKQQPAPARQQSAPARQQPAPARQQPAQPQQAKQQPSQASRPERPLEPPAHPEPTAWPGQQPPAAAAPGEGPKKKSRRRRRRRRKGKRPDGSQAAGSASQGEAAPPPGEPTFDPPDEMPED